MPERDIYHDTVKKALIEDGWTITHDPFTLYFGIRHLYIDLGAEYSIGAEKGNQKIAVEIKSFAGKSDMNELENSIGQYLLYQSVLKRNEPDRTLYLAVEEAVFEKIFKDVIGEIVLSDYSIKLIIFKKSEEVIIKWVK